MNYKLLLIPAALIALGVGWMTALRRRAASSIDTAQSAMQGFVAAQLPSAQSVGKNVINLLEDAVNAQHMWVVAYDQEGMFLIPAVSDPLTQTISRYESEAPAFSPPSDDSAGETDYVPFSAVTSAEVDTDRKRIRFIVGNESKTFKYQDKDCFGGDQQETIQRFLSTLGSIGGCAVSE